ncbi:MAG TPA: patatin-like phospholipase family protein [Acidimicrobiales bacterium]|nr:patatin-like phospholipase family protein [Acidimicrobiales bacterium]
MTLGLVLGAGGTVGLAYHAGVLRALEREAGIVPNDADLVIGTSAGSVISAYLRSGWTTEQMWDLVLSDGDLPPAPGDEGGVDGLPELFRLAFTTPLDGARRALGSAFVLSRTMLRVPVPALPALLRRAFPAGMFYMAEGRKRFRSELPEAWPDKPTWLIAVDIVSGRRMVLGRRPSRSLTLPQAVMASCAIPGLYPPVRYGRRELIDGGAHSTTNLDLAARFGCDLIVGAVPMGYDENDPPGTILRATRRLANRSLATEVATAKRNGAKVLLLMPSAQEVALHGVNMMRAANLFPVAQAAYDTTCRRLATEPVRAMLAEAAA